MAEVARKSGLTRESLYKAPSEKGNPAFATVLRVMDAMGLHLSVMPRAGVAKGDAAVHGRSRMRVAERIHAPG